MTDPGEESEIERVIVAAIEKHARGDVEALARGIIEELRDALAQKGIRVGRSSVDRFLKARELTYKKSRSTPPSRAGRTWQPRARLGASVNRG